MTRAQSCSTRTWRRAEADMVVGRRRAAVDGPTLATASRNLHYRQKRHTPCTHSLCAQEEAVYLEAFCALVRVLKRRQIEQDLRASVGEVTAGQLQQHLLAQGYGSKLAVEKEPLLLCTTVDLPAPVQLRGRSDSPAGRRGPRGAAPCAECFPAAGVRPARQEAPAAAAPATASEPHLTAHEHVP